MKPISEMTLTELDDEIVELQCKQMADEWEDNAQRSPMRTGCVCQRCAVNVRTA